MDPEPLLEKSASPVAHVSGRMQLVTLLVRKELLLKLRRPLLTVFEILFPVALCAILIAGSSAATTNHYNSSSFAPEDFDAVLGSLGPQVQLPLLAEGGALSTSAYAGGLPSIPVPGAVPPLGLFLLYANIISLCAPKLAVAPADGTAFAVAPDNSETRRIARLLVTDTDLRRELEKLEAIDPAAKTRTFDAISQFCDASLPPGHHGRGRGFPDSLAGLMPNVTTLFFEDAEALRQHAQAHGRVWAGLSFSTDAQGSLNASGQWNYTLSFNVSAVPSTGSGLKPGDFNLFDQFNSGLANYVFQYYASGFLSLQTALNTLVLDGAGGSRQPVPWPYGVPFPIAAYQHNVFFDFAGNLIGLVLVFSFLVPLGLMLKALVNEREARLRELLLIMGTPLPVYYTSILITYGLTFILIGLIGAVEIGLSVYTHSDLSLVLVLFILFALASLAFALALSPFFKNARVGAFLGPLLFFLSSQLYNLFLDKGRLQQGNAPGKLAASFLPAMAFYIGASELSMYEGSEQGVSWATMWEGEWPVGSAVLMLGLDIVLYVLLAWYLDQVVPTEFGLQRKPWFLLTPAYWRGGNGGPPRRTRVRAAGGALLDPLGSRSDGSDADHDADHGGGNNGDGSAVEGRTKAAAAVVEEPLAELPADEEGHGVRTYGLRKVFPRGVAVQGLDLEMRRGAITALLGANGAGKTTTISMLTGLIAPDGGDATVDGISIRSGMKAIRRALGVCPQLNTLFGEMTPAQHLQLYGALRGLSGARLGASVDTLLAQVGLAERREARADALSGGQKRKLCLAISLTGRSSTVVLDEPTSGMDPHSRRAIWALLRSYREGRTVVLTTHFLDEAELLSDRIAIMAEGALRCVGSALFLKAQLGVGYRLTLTKQPSGYDGARLLELVQRELPAASLGLDRRLEAEVQLPGQDMRRFAKVFAELEASSASLGVAAYGVSCTTLEDVFLRINEHKLLRLAQADQGATPQPSPAPPARRGGGASTAEAEAEAEAEAGSYAAGYGATGGGGAGGAALPAASASASPASARGVAAMYAGLVTKRRLTSQRDLCTSCCQLLFPVLLVLIALALLKVNVAAVGPRLELTADIAMPAFMPRPVPLYYADGANTAPLVGGWAAEGWAPTAVDGVSAATPAPGADGGPSCANLNVSVPGLPVPPATIARLLQEPCSKVRGFVNLTHGLSEYLAAHPELSRPAGIGYSQPLDTKPLGAALAPLGLPLGLPESVQLASLFYNSTSIHALPTLVAALYNASLSRATGGRQSIAAAAHALPRVSVEVAQRSAFTSLFGAILILIPLAFAAASYVTPHVRERESGSKQMQFVSGVPPALYWLGSWTWDVLIYLSLTALLMATFLLMQDDAFTGNGETAVATLLLLLLFGWASLPLASLVSYCFRSPSNALIAMIGFYFLSGFGLIVADFIMSSIGGNTATVNAQLRGWYYLCPAYCLGRGFFTLSTRNAFAALVAPKPLFDWDMLGAPLTYLASEGAAFVLATLLAQVLAATALAPPSAWLHALPLGSLRPSPPSRQNSPPRASPVGAELSGDQTPELRRPPGSSPDVAAVAAGGAAASGLEDESAAAERAAVDAGAYSADGLVLRHLRKQYGAGKLAVRDLCLRIQPGECFGFLGVNGAGKSTTFSMLTGAVTPTSGDALLYGLSILRDQQALRRVVGYCPQHDALEGLLSARETLRMYARIKRVPSAMLEAEVASLLADLDLEAIADKPAGTYSGGNKRKLCVGIALVGSPRLVLLDEPSSGMDAGSKRFLWSVIKRRTVDCCTVLTTHSMEECEALCARLGVMVDGVMRCVGPIQALKSRYGQGYKVDLRMEPLAMAATASGPPVPASTAAGSASAPAPSALATATATAPSAGTPVERLVAFMRERCPEAVLEEVEPPSLTFTVPTGAAALSHLFGQLAEAQAELHVSECSVTQCTLEQIFLLMASKSTLRNNGASEEEQLA